MRIGTLRDLDEFINYVFRRRLVWISHAKVDNVFTSRARSSLQFIYDIEDIGWKTFNPWKIVDQAVIPVKLYEFSALADFANITDNLTRRQSALWTGTQYEIQSREELSQYHPALSTG